MFRVAAPRRGVVLVRSAGGFLPRLGRVVGQGSGVVLVVRGTTSRGASVGVVVTGVVVVGLGGVVVLRGAVS